MRSEIRYGKAEISLYRTHARRLRVAPIPESGFTGRSNLLFAALVTVDVYGDNFLSSYTEGDNTQVVATDTMKNFTYAAALEYDGATQEGFAAHLARRFLETYPQMQRVRIRARELPYLDHSEKLLSPGLGDHGVVELEADRSGVLSLQAGRAGLKLVKLTGSAFASFLRDRWTTLPERQDRPLHIHLDVSWRYTDPTLAVGAGSPGYVASEQVADHVRHTFDDFVSLSIQHLVHEMGTRLLDRFQQLSEVGFEAENRLWDTSLSDQDDPKVRVYSDPKPAFGSIGLVLRRE